MSHEFSSSVLLFVSAAQGSTIDALQPCRFHVCEPTSDETSSVHPHAAQQNTQTLAEQGVHTTAREKLKWDLFQVGPFL